MSRKNSREEKARRRLENAWKLDRYSPIPTPDEYISHIGFVPNDPFFYNSAVASIINGQQFAFRTKNQLVDYVNTQDFWTKECLTKSGKSYVEVSCYYLIDKKARKNAYTPNGSFTKEEVKKFRREQNIATNVKAGGFSLKESQEGNPTALYMVRHKMIDGKIVKDENDWKAKNPCYTGFNTIWVDLDEVENLPEGLFTDDERVHFSKFNEAIQPMDEEELDRMFNAGSESVLHEYYETNEDGEIIIDEFFNDEGKSIGFQPRKTRETWLRMFHPFPIQYKRGKLMIGAAPETENILTKQTNDYS